MTRQKIALIFAFLLTALLGGASVQPAFCFSQRNFFSGMPSVKPEFSAGAIKINTGKINTGKDTALKPAPSASKAPSIDALFGAAQVFARAA